MIRTQHLLQFVFPLMLIQGLGQDTSGPSLRAQANTGDPIASIPTDGLIHWWPDPVEGTDQVTGRKGIRRGFGPLDDDPDVRLGYAAGWVELGPGITNRTFTLTGWLMEAPFGKICPSHSIISQDSGLENGWVFRRTAHLQFVSRSSLPMDAGAQGRPGPGWHSFAIRVTPGTAELWLDGDPKGKSIAAMPDSGSPGPLCVGNSALGSSPWEGDLRDLRIFDRLLSDPEIQSLSRTQRSPPLPITPAAVSLGTHVVDVRQGQSSEYRLRNISPEDGGPESPIQALHRAGDGALWLGTERGAVRFDGRQFQTDAAAAAQFEIAGSDVLAMSEDSDGTRWFGLFDGLVRQQGTEWTSHSPHLGPARIVRCMAPVSDGTVWLACNRDPPPRGRTQLRNFDPATGQILVEIPVPGQVRDLRFHGGILWVATDEPPALWRLDGAEEGPRLCLQLASYPVKEGSARTTTLAQQSILSSELGLDAKLFAERDGPLQWAIVRAGESGPSWCWTFEPGNDWHCTTADANGTLAYWVPGRGFLLRRVDERRESWERIVLGPRTSTSPVVAVAADGDGGVWAATPAEGLWYVQPRKIRMLTEKEGWTTEAVASLLKTPEGQLLIGGREYTLAELDPYGVVPPQSFPREIKKTAPGLGLGYLLAQRRDGSVFRADANPGADGIHCRQGSNTGNWSFFGLDSLSIALSGVSQLHVSMDQSVWLASERRLLRVPGSIASPLEGRSQSLWAPEFDSMLDSLPSHVSLLGLSEAADGAIWVGSVGGGLFRVAEGRIENIPIGDHSMKTFCIPLGFSSDGTLWLGGDDGLGIWRAGKVQWLRTEAGLPESTVADVEEAEGYVWFAGLRGVHGIRREELDTYFGGRSDRVSAISLGRSDGLASTEVDLRCQPVMAKTDDGQIWIATAQGVAHFQPRDLLLRLHPPPIAINALKANGRSVKLRPSGIRLPPDGRHAVEFSFSSVTHDTGNRGVFEYRLTGSGVPRDEVIAETSQGYALFPYLQPGRHRFSVRARSANGLWSDPPAQMEFTVEPHLHETPAFLAMMSFGGVLLVAGAVGWRVRRQASREEALRLHAERHRIARDMHDELGAELSRLALRADGIPLRSPSKSCSAGPTPESPDAAGLVRSLEEIVWLVNPSKDTLESVVCYLGSWVRDYFKDAPLEISLELPMVIPELSVSAEWRHHLLRLVKEACHNILKHARATQVDFTLQIFPKANSLELDLHDDGCGFEVGNRSPGTGAPDHGSLHRLGGNGLGNLHRRADQLNGELHLQSAPGQGTRVHLTVPLPPK